MTELDSLEKFVQLMESINEKQKLIESMDQQKESLKNEISELLNTLKEITVNSTFQYNGNWYSIKERNGKKFITNFEKVKPGSWLKKEKE